MNEKDKRGKRKSYMKEKKKKQRARRKAERREQINEAAPKSKARWGKAIKGPNDLPPEGERKLVDAYLDSRGRATQYRGVPICYAYQQAEGSKCFPAENPTGLDEWCGRSFLHLCQGCLGNHPMKECPNKGRKILKEADTSKDRFKATGRRTDDDDDDDDVE